MLKHKVYKISVLIFYMDVNKVALGSLIMLLSISTMIYGKITHYTLNNHAFFSMAYSLGCLGFLVGVIGVYMGHSYT